MEYPVSGHWNGFSGSVGRELAGWGVSSRRLVIESVLSGMSQAEVARRYGVTQGWISKLMARYRAEGDAAFEPRSTAPKQVANATDSKTVAIVVQIRDDLTRRGVDAGAQTIGWHLEKHYKIRLSSATIHRILRRSDKVIPEPRKRPKSSYIRFEASRPNECWQSDFTHYRLTNPNGTPGQDAEIITWLDDHARYVVHSSAHHRITAKIAKDTFCQAGQTHGYPASTLTDNGMVYTVRLAATGVKGGRTMLETELHNRNIKQKNGRPNHPTTQGKIERYQQTLKKWLTAQAKQPQNIKELQTLIDEFTSYYNTERPHRSLPNNATPTTIYNNHPKAYPPNEKQTPNHNRVRTDKVDKEGSVSLRVHGKLRHIGIGRTHARTPIKLLIQDLNVTIINAATGEIIRELTIDLTKDHQAVSNPNCQPQNPKQK